MSEPLTLVAVLVVGFVTGFFDSVVGAGGLVAIPSLIFLGLPPQVAIATDRIGVLGQTIGSLIKYWRAQKIVWKFVPILAVISLFSSIVGTKILFAIDQEILQTIIGVLIIMLIPLIFWKSELGLSRTKVSKAREIAGFFVYFLVMTFGAIFSQGTGPMIFLTFTYFLGLTAIEVFATNAISWFVIAASSLVIFAANDAINYKAGLAMFIGMVIGGYAGAHFAVKKGDLWIKRLFACLVVILAIRLLFF